jgi:hypothetical protein
MKHLALATLVHVLAVCALMACTPADRVQLVKTALDSADKGCKAYLELRKEPEVADAGAD